MARNLADEGPGVTLVSKDLPLRIKASAVGLDAEEYRAEASATPTPATPAWPSSRSPAAELDELYDDGVLDLEDGARAALPHRAWCCSPTAARALGRVGPDKQVHLVRGDREAFGIHGRSAEQRIALEMLLDPEVGIVSLGGRAGTGKSALALCAGLEAVLERRQHQKVVVFRPLFAVGGQELGYLPGTSRRRCRPGRRRSSTPSARSPPGRDRRGARPRACSRCCR